MRRAGPRPLALLLQADPRWLLVGLVAALVCTLPSQLSLAKEPRRGEAPLSPLPRAALEGLDPWLELGDLVLLESRPDGSLKQVSIIGAARAPASLVFEVLNRPEDYSKMIPSMVRSEVVFREGRVSRVAWELEIPFTNPEGVNQYIDDSPRSVRYYPISGSVPYAAWRWEALVRGEGSCIIVHQTTADLRQISWIVRRFLDAWPTFEHGAVASTAIVFLRAVSSRAEELHRGSSQPRPGYTPSRKVRIRSLRAGSRQPDPAALSALLDRGLVALVEYSDQGEFQQCSIISRVAASPEKVRELLADPAAQPDFVPTVTAVKIRRDGGDWVEYHQWLEMPLIDLKLHVLMKRGQRRFMLRSLPDGHLPLSNSGWEILPGPAPGSSLLLYYLYSDPGEISWFVRKLLEKEPAFNPGLNLATGLVYTRAIVDHMEGNYGGSQVLP